MSRAASVPGYDVGIPPAERERLMHETHGPLALGVTFSFFALTTLVVALRMYTRLRISRLVWWDDWMIVGSEVSLTICWKKWYVLMVADVRCF